MRKEFLFLLSTMFIGGFLYSMEDIDPSFASYLSPTDFGGPSSDVFGMEDEPGLGEESYSEESLPSEEEVDPSRFLSPTDYRDPEQMRIDYGVFQLSNLETGQGQLNSPMVGFNSRPTRGCLLNSTNNVSSMLSMPIARDFWGRVPENNMSNMSAPYEPQATCEFRGRISAFNEWIKRDFGKKLKSLDLDLNYSTEKGISVSQEVLEWLRNTAPLKSLVLRKVRGGSKYLDYLGKIGSLEELACVSGIPSIHGLCRVLQSSSSIKKLEINRCVLAKNILLKFPPMRCLEKLFINASEIIRRERPGPVNRPFTMEDLVEMLKDKLYPKLRSIMFNGKEVIHLVGGKLSEIYQAREKSAPSQNRSHMQRGMGQQATGFSGESFLGRLLQRQQMIRMQQVMQMRQRQQMMQAQRPRPMFPPARSLPGFSHPPQAPQGNGSYQKDYYRRGGSGGY